MMVSVSLVTAIIASFANMFALSNIALWEHEQRMTVVQEYMTWKQLPGALQQTVREYFHYLWSTNDGVQDHVILSKIPWHLRKDIVYQIQGEVLERCCLFRNMDRQFIESLSLLLKPVLLGPRQFVYKIKQNADRMWLLQHGKCQVLDEHDRITQIVEENSFFGEYALLGATRRREGVKTVCNQSLFRLPFCNFAIRTLCYLKSNKIFDIF